MEIDTTEYELEHLDEYDNLTQLHLMIREIECIMEHGDQPSMEWYEHRMDKVLAYSALNWSQLAMHPDLYVSDISQRIHRYCLEIMDQWSTCPIFDLSTFYALVHAIEDIRSYYFKYYATPDEDDIFDLIAGINAL